MQVHNPGISSPTYRGGATGRHRPYCTGYSAVTIYADMCCSQCVAQSLRRRESLKALYPFHTIHSAFQRILIRLTIYAHTPLILSGFSVAVIIFPSSRTRTGGAFIFTSCIKFSIADTWMWCCRRLSDCQSLDQSSSTTLKPADSLNPSMYTYIVLTLCSREALS